MKKSVSNAFLIALSFAIASVASADSNWPAFRGPTQQGHSDAVGLPVTFGETENVVWKTEIHDLGWSTPVVWGDQVSLSEATVERTLRAHASGRGRRVTLPLVAVDNPYVQYVVDAGTQRIVEVRERREGRSCEPGGLADVGVFCLSVDGLEQAWVVYRRSAHPGERTGEVAFLPFLPYLNSCAGWSTSRVGVGDPAETRGVNTLDDLEFFRGQLVSRSR